MRRFAAPAVVLTLAAGALAPIASGAAPPRSWAQAQIEAVVGAGLMGTASDPASCRPEGASALRVGGRRTAARAAPQPSGEAGRARAAPGRSRDAGRGGLLGGADPLFQRRRDEVAAGRG